MTDRDASHTRTYVSGADTRKAPAPTQVANMRAFFDVVEKSALVSSQVLVEARQALAGKDEDPPDAAARWFREKGILSRWQCRMLLEGKRGFFLGRYRLVERIGAGGMGSVFKAEHQLMNRVVALKVIRRNLVRDPHTLARFLREIKAVASLVHPNIVTAYDADCVGDTYFLVMEYFEGKDLDWWVRTQGPLPLRWACDFCRQVAEGLQHAHERGLVHRDIKPKNLLAVLEQPDKPYVIKILDFGLARLVSEQHEGHEVDKAVIGSFGYMAPEHVRHPMRADIRGDIFSLGCTLHYLLTGVTPFAGASDEEVLEKLLHGSPAPLRELLPSAPPALEKIVAKMLAHDPADRFQTPQEVAQALASFSAITIKSFAGANTPVPLVALSPPLPPLRQVDSPAEPEAGHDWTLNELGDRLTSQPESMDTSGIHSLLAADLDPVTGSVRLPETKVGMGIHTVRSPALPKNATWPILAVVGGGLAMLAMLYGLWRLDNSSKDNAPEQTIEERAPDAPAPP
jgi:serine/threonine-protein kinase